VTPLDETKAAQSAARAAMAELAASVTSADTERTIAQRAVECLRAEGVYTTWYYDCPALVLLGSRSSASFSGRDYVPADEPVGECNLATADLSPLLDGAAGDYARSLCVEGGRGATPTPVSAILLSSPERRSCATCWADGGRGVLSSRV